jgi:hypothetical protein
MDKKEQRFLIKYFGMKNWGSKKIHQELVTTLIAGAYGEAQIKIWLQKFRNGDFSCKNAPRTGRPPLTLRQQLATFLQKYPFASVRVLAQHFLASVPTIEEILERGMGSKKVWRCWVPHFLSPAPKVARVEALTEMLRILHESERTILKESQQVTSRDSNTPIPPQQRSRHHRQISPQGSGRPSQRRKL